MDRCISQVIFNRTRVEQIFKIVSIATFCNENKYKEELLIVKGRTNLQDNNSGRITYS